MILNQVIGKNDFIKRFNEKWCHNTNGEFVNIFGDTLNSMQFLREGFKKKIKLIMENSI